MERDPSEPPFEEWFWPLLESSKPSLRALCRKLEALSKEQLFCFQRQYADAMDYVYRDHWDDPELPPTVRESGLGDDFRAWVVSQGKAFYYEVRSNPDRLQKYLDTFEACDTGSGFAELRWDREVDRDEYRGYQCPSMIAFPIFEARFGKSMKEAIYTGRSEVP